MPSSIARQVVLLLAPLAPHIAEELWQRLGNSRSLALEPWPEADPAYLSSDTLEIPVQINGKIRGKIEVAADAQESEVIGAARADESIARHLAGRSISRAIYVPRRILSFVIDS
jgi:leucyl-tRNA synthetase